MSNPVTYGSEISLCLWVSDTFYDLQEFESYFMFDVVAHRLYPSSFMGAK